MSSKVFGAILASALIVMPLAATAQQIDPETLFRNVRVFNGTSGQLSAPTNVLVRGNKIAAIGESSTSSGATVIEGGGRTLMPGLIDAHTHIMLEACRKWS